MKYVQPLGVVDPNASYIDGNPDTGTKGSAVPAASIENPQREVVNLIADAGAVTPANTDLHQLGKSIQSCKMNFGVDIGLVNAMVVPLSPIPDAYCAGMIIRFKAKFAPTAATTLDGGRGARSVVKSGGAPLVGSEWSIGDIVTVVYEDVTGHWQLPPSPIAMLYAPRDYYVDATAGLDTNDGLSAGKAFRTLQYAQDTCALFNLNGFSITIHVANGSYGPVNMGQINGAGTISYVGNTITPSACVVTNTNGPCFTCVGRRYFVSGFKVTSTGHSAGNTGSGLYAVSGGVLVVYNIEFGYCIDNHIVADGAAQISYYGPSIISGGAGGSHMLAQNGSNIAQAATPTSLNITAPVNIGVFAQSAGSAVVGVTFSPYLGASNVTGQKYSASSNGVVNAFGNGVNYYPGTIAGSLSTGGQYV